MYMILKYKWWILSAGLVAIAVWQKDKIMSLFSK